MCHFNKRFLLMNKTFYFINLIVNIQAVTVSTTIALAHVNLKICVKNLLGCTPWVNPETKREQFAIS